MKILMIHVGNSIDKKEPGKSDDYYLKRLSFPDFQEKLYSKWDIVNADSQMNSIQNLGVSIAYGHFTERKSFFSLIRAGISLRKICKKTDPDIVHVFWGTTTALMTTVFSTKPVVISFSGSDLLGTVTKNGKKRIFGYISILFSQLSALLAKKIITKSEHMKQSLWPLSRKKATVVPNGLDLALFYPKNKNECREKIGWPLNIKTLIFFDGGGAPVKNIELAKKTFSIVKEKYPDAELRILNSIRHDALPEYYNAADVMLLTSFHEGSNNSLKEAMACNLPIVSVPCGDAPERLEKVVNCHVSKKYDADELAMYIIEILKKGTRSDGRKYINDFSLEEIGKRVVSVYKQILLK